MINYDIASHTYDNTRGPSDRLIQRFAEKVPLLKSTAVLDFGCGTGNFLTSLQTEFGCQCCGVDPSTGMRKKARGKNADLDIRAGDHNCVPFDEDRFDFAYLIDVIHHVMNLGSLFSELRRVLKPGSYLCIVTESHKQIQNRFYNNYFPSLSDCEKRRYPDISDIVDVAEEFGFFLENTEILPAPPIIQITERVVRTVIEKNFSMFHYLDGLEFADGLRVLRKDLGKRIEVPGRGETLIWMKA